MPQVHKTILLPYTAEQMYQLVEKVEDYPQFLPWCGGAQVHSRTETTLEASVVIAFKSLSQTFRTSNENVPNERMIMHFKDGPFRHLTGKWQFTPVGSDGEGVKVEFDLDYEFSNKLFALAIGPVFSMIAQTFIDGFITRAKELYA
ncbi:type II toxin-antitoxin system RatA family toxin [Hydromonas duriensis]|uniref:Ribosome-associated toxin RatA of RatAB toxin-antitoxin module n=1 Tax=Hydromonas duriensis TaxID=1527608 RepID=A0A4R6Y8I5_9BURK|nr:type II toxin-antitoxin system RatA family toxin [Hydromonas duriensis]TDR31719.1 ribosome-associated toxin RatA of RatAB toxin-antitoxin module [Hydromonas duriensis]